MIGKLNYHIGHSQIKTVDQVFFGEILYFCVSISFQKKYFWSFPNLIAPQGSTPGLAFSGIGYLSLVHVLSGQFTQFKTLAPRAQTSNYQIVYFPLFVHFCIQIFKKRKNKPNPKNCFLFLCLYFILSVKESRLQLTPEMEQRSCVGTENWGTRASHPFRGNTVTERIRNHMFTAQFKQDVSRQPLPHVI